MLLSECRGIELVLRKDSSLNELNISLPHPSKKIYKKILVKLDNGSFRPIFAGTSLDRPYLYVDESDIIKSVNHKAMENAIYDLTGMNKSANIINAIQDATFSIEKVDLGQYKIKSLSFILRYIGIPTIFEYCKKHEHMHDEYFVISEIGDGEDDQVKMDCLKIFNKFAKSKGPPKKRKLVIKQLVNLAKSDIEWDKEKNLCKTVEQGIP
ncbi:hypothetical protein niasHT_022710 [Heterodera trifolii]|uniref:Uncharacterized protein n=1 Tax=Heterodera trifolii TaxID=157864 RepID=A0ABD2KJL1_9BILA